MNANDVRALTDADNAALPVPDSAATDPAMLEGKLLTLQENHLHLAADFDNFRKRTRRDAEQQAAAAKDAFILELLPVLDNLERALVHVQGYEGARMALQQLSQLLRRHDIAAVEDMGRPFDPHRQEAVFVRHDPMQPDQFVLEVTQRGYCRGDEVFRPAKVVVNDLTHLPGADDVC